MRVRWATDAADDLEQSVTTLHKASLESFPHIGRTGRVRDTREIAFPPLPFVAVYEVVVGQDEVRGLRILHGAQQWPPR